MSYIVLAQRIEHQSTYKDIPFVTYHFPKIYRNQIQQGSVFVYYQGKQGPVTSQRYYFGTGVVGEIYPDLNDPDHFYADLVDARPLPNKVPIYLPAGGYYESIGYEEVRNQPIPAWQRSVRPISKAAFLAILEAGAASTRLEDLMEIVDVESEPNFLSVLTRLNQKYTDAPPAKRGSIVERYVDRGGSVARVLKRILGSTCQLCGNPGFRTRSGSHYIEAHHLVEVSKLLPNSLCSDNIILVCPTCHRKLHYAPWTVHAKETSVTIQMFGNHVTIQRNTYEYLASKMTETGALV